MYVKIDLLAPIFAYKIRISRQELRKRCKGRWQGREELNISYVRDFKAGREEVAELLPFLFFTSFSAFANKDSAAIRTSGTMNAGSRIWRAWGIVESGVGKEKE